MKLVKVIGGVLVALLLFSCGAPKLAQTDLDAANAAFADAQNAKADAYAPDAFKAAQDAKAALDAELAAQDAKTSGKSYKQANDLIKAFADASNKAKEAAATNMDQVKGEVAQLITDIDTQYANVQALAQAASKDAKKAAKAKLNVKDIEAKVAAAGQAITDAKAANDSQDYAGARDQLNAVKSTLDELKSTLEAAGFTAQ
ncbi:MAG: hypothetical protein ABFC85_03605 [Rectinema sp.]|uniref:Lipoprotein n=1 Tax=uncultured spirochete TaxID=156406 RepID=A0A3P3XRS7_9SPIR|nr:exported hypothetical protein [uncultured spirochete]